MFRNIQSNGFKNKLNAYLVSQEKIILSKEAAFKTSGPQTLWLNFENETEFSFSYCTYFL